MFSINGSEPCNNKYSKISMDEAYAAQCKSIHCFKYLLLNGSDPLQSAIICGWNSMTFAVSQNQLFMIQLLIEKKLSVNISAYEAMAKFHQNSLLSFYIEKKEIKNDCLLNAFQTAILWDNFEGVEICLGFQGKEKITDDQKIKF